MSSMLVYDENAVFYGGQYKKRMDLVTGNQIPALIPLL
jgi:hypothetical protein